MKIFSTKIFSVALLAGVASTAFAGAVAANTLTVQLPDGATEQITYSGDVAPQVSFTPTQAAPAADRAFGPQSPFALMQQIAAQPLAGPGQPIQIDMTTLPPGTQSYSFVSTLSPSGVCSQSTEIIAQGSAQKPQMITHRSGNCGGVGLDGAARNVAAPDQTPAPEQMPAETHQAKAIDHPDYRSMFREASW